MTLLQCFIVVVILAVVACVLAHIGRDSKETANNTEAYRCTFNHMMFTNSYQTLLNCSDENARYIIARFLEAANDNVNILICDIETAKIYVDILPLLNATAQRLGDNFKLIFCNISSAPGFSGIIDAFKANDVAYHVISTSGKSTSFLIVDSKRYRATNKLRRATVCCNDPHKSAELNSYFQVCWNTCCKVEG